MMKRVSMISIASLASTAFLFSSCGKSGDSGNGEKSEDTSEDTSGVLFKSVSIRNIAAANHFAKSSNFAAETPPLNYTSLTLDVKCPRALPGGNDYNDTGVIIDSEHPTFKLVEGVPCSVTLQNYVDNAESKNSFTPTSSPLELFISTNGMATSVTAAVPYLKASQEQNSSTTLYFAAGTSSAYTILLNYGDDPDEVAMQLSNLCMVNASVVSEPGAKEPTVTELQLSRVGISNGFDYSLYGKVTESTACKIFPFSSLNAFDYNTIHNAFSGASGTECPVDILSGRQGNWTPYAKEARVIIWGNIQTDKLLYGYTYVKTPAYTD